MLVLVLAVQTIAWSSELVHSAEQDTTYALSRVEKTIEGQNARGPYQLSDHFISADSESLWVDHKLQVADRDYKINYAAGEVMFTEPISKGAAIRARFRQIPVFLDGRVYRHKYKAPKKPFAICRRLVLIPLECACQSRKAEAMCLVRYRRDCPPKFISYALCCLTGMEPFEQFDFTVRPQAPPPCF